MPGEILPFASVDPADPDNLAHLEEMVADGALGVKLYSGHTNLYDKPLDDEAMMPIYAYLAESQLPINWHVNLARYYDELTRVLDKHPNLKIISVENDIGWLPGFLKRMDWYSYRFSPRFPQMQKSGGDYWRTQIYSTFQDDEPGMRCRDMLGVTQLMWGSDYPHFDSTFPKSQEAIRRNFEGVPDDERRAILGGTLGDLLGYKAPVAV